MLTVASFDNVIYAEMLKLKLESEGVRCCIADANFVGMDWFLSNASGGVKVQILGEDAEQVRSLLEGMVEVPGRYILLAPKRPCPRCGSMNIRRRILPVLLGVLLLHFPLPFYGHGFKCRRCGHRFRRFAARETAGQAVE